VERFLLDSEAAVKAKPACVLVARQRCERVCVQLTDVVVVSAGLAPVSVIAKI